MEPVVGLEPTTDGLQNRCSTTELNWHRSLNHQLALKISPALERFQTQFGAPVSGRSYGSEKHPPKAPAQASAAYFARDRLDGKSIRRCTESEFEVNALEIVRFRKCGRMIRRVACCLQFGELSS